MLMKEPNGLNNVFTCFLMVLMSLKLTVFKKMNAISNLPFFLFVCLLSGLSKTKLQMFLRKYKKIFYFLGYLEVYLMVWLMLRSFLSDYIRDFFYFVNECFF